MTELSWLVPAAAFAMVFVIALLAARALSSGTAARLEQRLRAIKLEGAEDSAAPMIRERYLRRFSPFERRLEELPGMAAVARLIEQAGYTFPAYRLVGLAATFALVGALLAWWFTHHAGLVLLGALVAAVLPVLQIYEKRGERLRLFEEQLPDALDMMARALRAGNPLVETFRFAAEEMDEPVSKELGTTWSHLNYGVSLKASFDDMIRRMPCTSLRAMATAILVQRETGGNLAEILDKISAVLRQRFRFQRRVRTLTAEGRMSAWVLILMPFGLSVLLSVTSPEYLPMLLREPTGRLLILGAVGLMSIGILWIRRVIRIRI
ncbi:type II secretion system F family protein [Fontimonas sp. SYSU GA230001]|uniref:type II secretion system F family protein n=1 Tax=Fontimonas sp. SYSU GA230001 TaxID=3142450 RepID=UPI0032B40504